MIYVCYKNRMMIFRNRFIKLVKYECEIFFKIFIVKRIKYYNYDNWLECLKK